jgi:hypothetical protein
MAFDPKPTTFFAGWSEDGTNVTLPLAAVPELTAAEADATGGDIRKVLYAILEQAALAYAALATDARPAKMVITRGTNLLTSGNLARSYTFAFELAPASVDVADEA